MTTHTIPRGHGSSSYQVIARNKKTGEEKHLGFTGRYTGAGLRALLRFDWAQVVAITGCESFEASTKKTNNMAVYEGNGWELKFSHRTFHEVTGRAN